MMTHALAIQSNGYAASCVLHVVGVEHISCPYVIGAYLGSLKM